jgi:hypothetical protein
LLLIGCGIGFTGAGFGAGGAGFGGGGGEFLGTFFVVVEDLLLFVGLSLARAVASKMQCLRQKCT